MPSWLGWCKTTTNWNGWGIERFMAVGLPHDVWSKNMDEADNRRKFRSQTSDNMDRWKAEQGRGREKRKSRRKKSRRERVRRKKMQMREKVGKSRNIVFFQWFVAPEGRKVGSLKRRVRSHLARREIKNCTLLWRGAHFQVKMYKAHHGRTTFGAKHISKWKCTKHTMLKPLLEVATSKKCTPLWREAHFEVKMVQMSFRMAGVGHLKRICIDAFSVAGTVQETCSWEMLRGQGADFLREVAFWSMRSVGLLRWFAWHVQHFVWSGINFSWQAQYFRQVEWKNRKTHWHKAVSVALTFPFLKEVSQNCFVFDVVKFKIWRSLAELLRFGCQGPKTKKSRRIVSFWALLCAKIEEVSQNCFVLDVAKVQKSRSLVELFRFGRCYVQKLKKSRRISSFLILQIDR